MIVDLAVEALQFFYVFVVCFISAYLVRHYIFTLAVLRHVKNPATHSIYVSTRFKPVVSILIPAHNEEKVIEKLLQRMAELTYPKDKLDVIVIDDASSDKTGLIAEKYAKRYSFIRALHRPPGIGGTGKAAAMNVGSKCAVGEIFLWFDADYCPPRNIVEKLAREFANPIVGAVQGRPVVLNEPQNFITRIVTLERISGYCIEQEARSILRLMPQFGGTVGGVRSCIFTKIGGLDESMLTEDTDLTLHVYEEGYKIVYVPDAECYEEAVDSLKAYWRQRHRWARGHMQVCCKHAFRVLRSRRLTLREKVDGLLLLHMYFLPVLTLFGFIASIMLILVGSSRLVSSVWFFIPLALYSFTGGFAPFFEVGIGAYLDGRKRLQWLHPLLMLVFLYNILICTKAFFDVFGGKILGRKQSNWAKTEHLGKGAHYAPPEAKSGWEQL